MMSDVPSEHEDYIAKLRRMNAETEKFIAEQRKLIAESEKFSAEQRKLSAESDKFAVEQRKLSAEAEKYARERAIAPWQLAVVTIGSIIGGVSGLFAAIITVLRAMGGAH